MELNIISVAFITGFIIIYVVSLIAYLILFVLDWRTYNGKLNFLEKAKAFLLGLAGCIPLVNTCILLYYFFNRSSE
jgi:ABC-type tungstate transport system substrate-binding protein